MQHPEGIPIPLPLEEIEANPDREAAAQAILAGRNQLMDAITPPFKDVNDVLTLKFNDPTLVSQQQTNELPPYTTRGLFENLLERPECVKVKEIWMKATGPLEKPDVMRFFGYVFNKLKKEKD